MTHRDARQGGNQGGGQGHTRGRTVFGHSPFRCVDMHVGVFQIIQRNPVFLGMYPCVADRQLGTFLHDIAQTSGDLNFAGTTRNHSHFDGKHFTAHTGPSQTVGDTNRIFAGNKRGFHLFGAQQRFDGCCRNADLLLLPCRDALCTFAQYRGDGPFQGTNACFACVSVDDFVQSAGGQRHAAFQAIVFELFGQKMPLGNVELFRAGIAGKLDHIHTVIQRPGDGGGIVGRRDKQNFT